MTTYNKPLPQPNADDEFFWRGCKKHKFLFQKCLDCGLIRWPPSFLCPQCWSGNTTIIEASGKGKVYTYAVYHLAYHEGFKSDLPYVTAIIELEEGPHFLSNITECNPVDVKCDMPVEIVWDDITAEFSLPKFKPVRVTT